ncbi:MULTISPECIES: NAD-dependent succinate-semialdehyde dehydrogenase [unclassified Bradyrhizobium]|uniref:NAD-dependent succinate-semialdehyde dehydrogenase n=1 Tax=unclassified Bradyrhizobium TaxID=2631580 RepID=UPI001FF92E80|nr:MULTISPECIES: NAD-dependent succinate-semialdehyde dehydrogenase [unclassified Bradyrhizobium]MCK1314053.1 NAD-dependent succinate-semialdehyde dehydrogenase [Bradyrhizobium sp. 23]MCK1401360.1 NAD-dependent succinate-semialdehyde dehydrogenase [Bradyrhizobium sp. 39]MCK1440694.1 NAD-dependent succinate-semialdehyde dehydrogenase [Bradyrhizobium sp. 15]MCK1614643.1 NAD-dependent succinate-semialdehyde dehydrogenase [Bradyrhizobium sp. 163]MCK1752338.1 NAD-dependent succinate-semialdehyde de
MYTKLALLIDGEWIEETNAGSETVLNPATEQPLGKLPHAGTEELDRALTAANRAFAGWRRTSPYERGQILRRAAGLMRERLDHIATVLTLEEGKTLAEARGEITAAAEFFDWFAEEGRRSYGRVIPARLPDMRQTVTQEPVGPVACFTPWNFPAVTPARKIAPALAAGCTCIIKPAEETPGTTLEIARALTDAGLPKGVLNVVFGIPAKVSEYLLRSPIIRKISFTGSTPVGRHLARLAGETLTLATMELGGHAPVIVAKDADVQRAAELSMTIKLRNTGQVCTSPTRFFVEQPVYEEYLEHARAFVEKQVVGDGLQAGTTVGPVANTRRVAAMDDLISDALSHSARLVVGGERLKGTGLMYRPTILADMPDRARAMREEPFGPLALVQPVDDLEQAIARANALPYGLAGYAFTRCAATANRIAEEMEVGVIGINQMVVTIPETPFGGIGDSGWGREGGIEGLESYTVRKYVGHLHV